MTQEEKQLLLKDLCARLPYGVTIKLGNCDYHVIGYNPTNPLPMMIWYYDKNNLKSFVHVYLEAYHPYLRPMSSMTKEEIWEWEKASKMAVCMEDKYLDAYNAHLSVDWLDAHYFDYRGLIEKGLALEAPKGMYQH